MTLAVAQSTLERRATRTISEKKKKEGPGRTRGAARGVAVDAGKRGRRDGGELEPLGRPVPEGAERVGARRKRRPQVARADDVRGRRGLCGNQNVQDTFNMVECELGERDRSQTSGDLQGMSRKDLILSERDEFQG
jgi:hypothetical protein